MNGWIWAFIMIRKYRTILYFVGIGMVLACAFFLRMNALTRYPFWLDEIYTERYTPFILNHVAAGVGMRPVEFLFANIAKDYSPPVYYVLVWLYGHFFSGDMALRMFSVIMGMAAVVVFYGVAGYFLRRKEALIAAAVMAASPFYIWYAQEARAYTTISFISLVAVYFFLKALKENRRRWWAAFFCGGVVAIATSYYCGILLIFLAVFLLWNSPRHLMLKGMFLVIFFGLFLVLCVPAFFVQADFIAQGKFWLPSPKVWTFLLSPVVFTAGYLAQPYQIVFGSVVCWWLWIRGLIIFSCEDKGKYAFLLLCSLLPLCVIFIFSRLWFPIYLDRQLIVFSPFLFICMVRAVASIKSMVIKSGTILVVGAFMILVVGAYDQGSIYCYNNIKGDFYQGVHPRKRYDHLMECVLTGLSAHDAVITADVQSLRIVTRALDKRFGTAEKNIFVFSRQTLDDFELKTIGNIDKFGIPFSACGKADACAFLYSSHAFQKINSSDLDFQRVWFVFSAWDHDFILSRNVRFTEKLIALGFHEIMSADQDGFFVRLYEKNITLRK